MSGGAGCHSLSPTMQSPTPGTPPWCNMPESPMGAGGRGRGKLMAASGECSIPHIDWEMLECGKGAKNWRYGAAGLEM